MTFTFEEVEIIKGCLTSPDKEEFIGLLENMELHTKDKSLKQCLLSLENKINEISQSEIEKLYQDRLEYKLSVAPFYFL